MSTPLIPKRPPGFLFRVIPAMVIGLASATMTRAHDPGLSTGQFTIFADRVETELTFARADIETVVKLDTNGDGEVSAVEWNAAQPLLTEVAQRALRVRIDEKSVPPESSRFRLDETNNFHLTATFPARGARQLVLTSTLIEQMPRGHRQFVSVQGETSGVQAEALLNADRNFIGVDLAEHAPPATFRSFLWLGVEHIVTGYDHLLFLFALLIVVPTFRGAALIITCFTLAHSITLGAATLNWFNLDARYVEPLIAATIVYVGIENLACRDVPRGRWLLTLVFGLIHGFGFASVLRDLGVNSGTTGITMPLFSFNLGVELGQLAIAAIVLPIVLACRKNPVFVRRFIPACSMAVIGAGSWWLVQRTLL